MEPFNVHEALLFSGWAFECLMFRPVGIVFGAAAISLIASGLQQRPFRKCLWKSHHWLVLAHGLFFVAAILVGTVWAEDPPTGRPPNQAALFWYYTLFFGSLASCIFWIWRMKGFRWFAASLVTLLQVLTLCALTIAGMSIAGDWL